ncbi:MAG TPA: MFS transporter [Candidatus Acidoferrales bacterium]
MFSLPRDVAAMIAALRFTDPDAGQLDELTSADWANLLTRHEFVRLIIPLRLTRADEMPMWVRSRVDAYLADNLARLDRIKASYRQISDVLCKVGAEHIVIKGFAQWPGFTDHPCFHLQSDIDLYCPSESILKARDAILALGYEPSKDKREASVDHLPALARRTAWCWTGNHFDPEMPASIELHHTFWNRQALGFGVQMDQDFWTRRVNRTFDDLTFPALALPDNLGYSALQILRDGFIDAISPAKLYQVARFLHFNRNDEAFWKLWYDVHPKQFRQMEAIAFLAARLVFKCSLAEPAEREVRDLPAPVEKWFDCFAERVFDHRLERPKIGIWLQMALIESAAERRAVALKYFSPYRPVSFKAFADREMATAKPERAQTPAETRRKYSQHIRKQVAARAKAVIPTVWLGAQYWWSKKKLNKGYWTFYSAGLLYDFGMFIFYLLYNLYLIERGFTAGFLGAVVSAGALGSVVGTVLSGVLCDRLGLRKSMLICFPLVAAVCALRSIIGVPSELIGLAFLGAVAATLWAVGLCPAVAQMTNEDNRAFGFSVILSSGIAVGVVGGIVGGHLPGWLSAIHARSQMQSEQVALLIGCVLIVLAAWPMSRVRLEPIPRRQRTLYPRDPFLWRFLPAVAVWSLVTGGFSPFFNAYFSQRLHMPVERIGTMYSLSHVSQVLAVLVAPLLFRRIGLVRGVMFTQIAAGISLAVLALVPSGFWTAALYTVFSAFEWMNEPGIFTLLMSRVQAEERTGASALMFLVISLSQAAAAALAGAGFTRFGYPAVMFATAGAALLAAILFGQLLGKSDAAAAAGNVALQHAGSVSFSKTGD